MAQANVSTAETEGNTEIMPDFECGKWLSSEASQEWGLASAGTAAPHRVKQTDRCVVQESTTTLMVSSTVTANPRRSGNGAHSA